MFSRKGVFAAERSNDMDNQRNFGEPIKLRGVGMYFTSWKYVRQGNFGWHAEGVPPLMAGEQLAGPLQSDGPMPAKFITNAMPFGIRLAAQRAGKIMMESGRFAAQVFDQGKYKCWYSIPPCQDPEPFSTKTRILPGYNDHLCYAESDDGITWHKPELGLFEYSGNKRNNIVLRGDVNGSTRGFPGGAVFVDPSSVAERYKLLYLAIATEQEWERFSRQYPDEVDPMAWRWDVASRFGLFGAVSPDGLHWTHLPDLLMIQHADTLNTCYYDLDREEYVAYIRAWQVDRKAVDASGQSTESWINVGRRVIGRSMSKNFRHFGKPEIVISTGADMAPNHVWYTNAKTTLPNCPDQHVMFPWLWDMSCDGGDCYLLSSADGWAWSQVPGGPVLERGALGGPDGGYVVCSVNLLEYPGDKWGIPFAGYPIPHKYPGRDVAKRQGLFPAVPNCTGLAVWPKGRLVALESPGEGGFATVAVMPPGDSIRLNAIVPPSGHIRVAVSLLGQGDQTGRSFEDCDSIVGDHLSVPVTWKGQGNLRHNGASIILMFKLKQAKLFGVEFV